jgi:ribosomal protein L11 methyltransferase
VNPPLKDWQLLSLVIPEAAVDDLSAHCFELDSCGLEVGDVDKTGSVEVVAYFSAAADAERLSTSIGDHLARLGFGSPRLEYRSLPDRDWNAEWRQYFTPIQVTPRIVVHPPWISADAEIAISILPQMAFGTGTHESTRLSLMALEDRVTAGCRCMDIGTGSGILAIAAVLLGAGSVLAIDTDQQAIDNAKGNLERNLVGGIQPELRTATVEATPEVGFDLIVANIQSSTLAPILPEVRRRLVDDGAVIFSGLLTLEEADFCRRVEATGLVVEAIRRENEWLCLTAGRGP